MSDTVDTRIEAMDLPGHRYPLIIRHHKSARFIAPRFLIPDCIEEGMEYAEVPPESEVLLNVETGSWSVLVSGKLLAEFARWLAPTDMTRKTVARFLTERLATTRKEP